MQKDIEREKLWWSKQHSKKKIAAANNTLCLDQNKGMEQF